MQVLTGGSAPKVEEGKSYRVSDGTVEYFCTQLLHSSMLVHTQLTVTVTVTERKSIQVEF